MKTRVTAEAATLEAAEIPEAATLAAATLVEETPVAAAVVVTPEVEAEEIPTSDSGTEPISHD